MINLLQIVTWKAVWPSLKPWAGLAATVAVALHSTAGGQEPVYLQPPPRPDIVTPNPSSPAPLRSAPARQQGSAADVGPVPAGHGELRPWWQPMVPRAVQQTEPVLPITLDELMVRALEHSSRIRAVSNSPLIRETAVVEADAEFDWTTFMETKWDDISEPVGNTLTTGGPTRFNDHRWDFRGGFRRKNHLGGSLELDQRYGYVNNNSVFTDPNPQRTSRLTLSYTQPLLRGAGRVYNTSLTMLAQIETGIAYDVFSRELQEHLLDVARAYWGLYLDRGSLLQKRRSYQRAATILADLEHRRTIDAVSSQVVRAEAAAAARRSELLRAETAVRNSESRIRMLVNDPGLGLVDQFELAPQDTPASDYIPVRMADCLATAFQNRPEISASIKRIRGAAVRLNMSKNELLPILDLVVESYIKGLAGKDVWEAWGNQYSEGAPTYSTGLQLEFPLHNRAARARCRRRRLEVRQFQSEFQTTVATLHAEVEVAVREVATSFREMHAKFEAMEAAAEDVGYIERRWKLLPGADQGASLLLEDLLTSQDRLVNEELNFLSSQVSYSLSMIELKRAVGTLLQYEHVVPIRTTSGDCLPRLQVTRSVPTSDSESQPPGGIPVIEQLPPMPESP